MSHSGRNIRLAKNTITSLLLQVVNVICGFILPRAILRYYGSEVNGLINSMTQFLQVIAFLELGVGAVVQSSLYAPLANNDNSKISEIVSAGNSFFKKIALILVAYVVILCFVFCGFLGNNFDSWYNITLLIALSSTFFIQYYFGIVDRLFLNAAQKAYIQNIISLITLIINTALCYSFVCMGFSIQIVKFTTSIIFFIRPILVRLYVNKHYRINRKARFFSDTIPQKMNGIAQHVAAIILDSTDIIILSVFSSMSSVSVYSVYNLVVAGIRQLFQQAFNGVMPMFGELWAKSERELLNTYFEKVEFVLHTSVLFIWCCGYYLIIPFVKVYTNGIKDTNYIIPLFALLICLASAANCLRLTYNSMILAAGHYKQTQHIFIIAALTNVVVSIATVHTWGIIGVTIGTIVAMLYQTIHMQYYCFAILKIHHFSKLLKQLVVDIVTVGIVWVLTRIIEFEVSGIYTWVLLSIKVAFLTLIGVMLSNTLMYGKQIKPLIREIINKNISDK